jgi:hypothetical protein
VNAEFRDELVGRDIQGLPDRFFDRFMFNLHPRDDVVPSLILGAGIYPGTNTVDVFAIATLAGHQRNLRFSTELDATNGHEAGPLSWSVEEPLRRWRLLLAPSEFGVELDVVWEARAPAWSGDVTVRDGENVSSSFEHLFQSGLYYGTLTLDGTPTDVTGWYGQRDRSRGVRTMSGGQGLHLWMQAQFPDRSIGFLLVEDRDHGRLLLEGAVMLVDGTLDPIVDVRHDLLFDEQLDLRSGTLLVSTESGAHYELEADADRRGGYLAGGGYGGHHGRPQGRDHLEIDRYALDGSVTPRTVDTALTDRMTRFRSGTETGLGIFEFAHSRSPRYRYVPSL